MTAHPMMQGALAALAALAAGIAHAQASPAPSAASAPMRGVVVDAAGVELGPYSGTKTVSGQGSAAVLVQLGGLPVVLALAAGKSHLQGTAFRDTTVLVPAMTAQRVYFKSGDCSGAAFVTADSSLLPGPAEAAVIADGNGGATVYLPARGAPRTEAFASSLGNNFGNNKIVCQAAAASISVFGVDTIVDLATVYQVPYHLE
jgi:hypothetical protein